MGGCLSGVGFAERESPLQLQFVKCTDHVSAMSNWFEKTGVLMPMEGTFLELMCPNLVLFVAVQRAL